jgi:hypothetical protein
MSKLDDNSTENEGVGDRTAENLAVGNAINSESSSATLDLEKAPVNASLPPPARTVHGFKVISAQRSF